MPPELSVGGDGTSSSVLWGTHCWRSVSSSPLPLSPPSLHTFVYSSTHHNQSSCSPHLHTHSFSFMDVDLNFFPIFTQSHSLICCNHLSPALSLHTAILADRYGMSQRIPQCYGHSMAHPRTRAEAPCAGPSEREGIHLSAPPADNP